MQKALVPIGRNKITEQLFGEYHFYYKIDSIEYCWCICWEQFLQKSKTYMDWYIQVPVSDITKFILP